MSTVSTNNKSNYTNKFSANVSSSFSIGKTHYSSLSNNLKFE